MIEVNKRDYKRALQWGFVPQNRVVHSIHRRHYYLSDSDFSQFIMCYCQDTQRSRKNYKDQTIC